MPAAKKKFVIKTFAKLGESKFIFVEIKMFERLTRINCAKIHETSSKSTKVHFFARMEKGICVLTLNMANKCDTAVALRQKL